MQKLLVLTDNKLIYHDRTRTRDFGIAHFTYEFQLINNYCFSDE
jgi:hypothetical protein